MGKAIVDFLASLVGHVRAGMSYVLLGALYLVSGISGSKLSDMATVAPALFPEIAAGSHVMEFSKEGFSSAKKDVVVNPGKTTNVMVALTYGETVATENASPFPWVPVLVVMTGLIVIAIGGYYYWSERKKNEWGKGKTPKAGDTKNRVPARKDTVVKDIIIREPEARKTAVDTTPARIPQAGNMVISNIPEQEQESSNTVINNIAAPEPEVIQPAISDTPPHGPEAGNTVISDPPACKPNVRPTVISEIPAAREPESDTPVVGDTAACKPNVRKTAARDTIVRKPKNSNTVVRVTLLKDIPDKEPGDNDTPDKRE
jgi:hypothetical protein